MMCLNILQPWQDLQTCRIFCKDSAKAREFQGRGLVDAKYMVCLNSSDIWIVYSKLGVQYFSCYSDTPYIWYLRHAIYLVFAKPQRGSCQLLLVTCQSLKKVEPSLQCSKLSIYHSYSDTPSIWYFLSLPKLESLS